MNVGNWFLIFVVALLISCSWLGSPAIPKVDLPQKFNSSSTDYQNIESLPYLAWWQQYNDSQLNYLIESGLKNNLDLSIALSNLEQSKAQLKQVQLEWVPYVNLFSGYAGNPALGNVGVFYAIWPQYTLNIMQLVKKQEQAKYNNEIVKAMVDGVRLTIIGQISNAYFTLLAEQKELELLNQLKFDLAELIKLSQDKITIGLSNNIILDDILANQKLIQSQIAVVQNNITLSQNSLRYLLNQNPGVIKSENNFAKLNFNQFKPGSLPATVLQNRPDLKIAEYEVKAAYAGVGVAYGNLFPSVQLDAFFGNMSGEDTFANPEHYVTIQDAYLNWGIKPSTFQQVEAQKGAYQAQVYRYIQTVRKILKDVDNDFSTNHQYTVKYINVQNAWQNLTDKYKLQQGLYKTGIISYPELLENKIKLDNFALMVNQAKLQQSITIVNLYQDLAGGYKYQKQESGSLKNTD